MRYIKLALMFQYVVIVHRSLRKRKVWSLQTEKLFPPCRFRFHSNRFPSLTDLSSQLVLYLVRTWMSFGWKTNNDGSTFCMRIEIYAIKISLNKFQLKTSAKSFPSSVPSHAPHRISSSGSMGKFVSKWALILF